MALIDCGKTLSSLFLFFVLNPLKLLKASSLFSQSCCNRALLIALDYFLSTICANHVVLA